MIYTFCAVGLRGYLAYRILTQHGFEKVRNLSGGLKTYRAATAPIIIHEENKRVGYRLNCTMRRRHEGTPDQLQ